MSANFILQIQLGTKSQVEAFRTAVEIALNHKLNVAIFDGEKDLGVFTHNNKYYTSFKSVEELLKKDDQGN